jgi:Sulfotransferase family
MLPLQLAPKIVRLYRSPSSSDSNNVTFQEFVQYLIDKRSWPLSDFHWTPQVDLCLPCSTRPGSSRVNFDFVGHYETLYDDADYVIAKLGISTDGTPFDRSFHKPSRLTGWQDRVRAAFFSIPIEHRNKLKQLYQYDFEAFGFDPNII